MHYNVLITYYSETLEKGERAKYSLTNSAYFQDLGKPEVSDIIANFEKSEIRGKLTIESSLLSGQIFIEGITISVQCGEEVVYNAALTGDKMSVYTDTFSSAPNLISDC